MLLSRFAGSYAFKYEASTLKDVDCRSDVIQADTPGVVS